MIVKYKRSDVAGEEWMRASRIIFENPPTGDFKVRFAEERAVALSDGTILTKPMGTLEASTPQSSLNDSFELIDPRAGEGSGSYMTYGQIHAALYSLYLLVSKRAHGTVSDADDGAPGPDDAGDA